MYICIRKILFNTAILYTSFTIAVADSRPNNIPSSEWMWVKRELEMTRYKQKYGQNLRYCPEVSVEGLRKLQNISAVTLDCLQAQIWSWPSIILGGDAKHQKTNLDLGNTLPTIYIYFKFQSLVTILSTLQIWHCTVRLTYIPSYQLDATVSLHNALYGKCRIFSNLIRTSFCRFFKRKKMLVRGSNSHLSFNHPLPTRQTDWIILDVTNALTVIRLTCRVWSGHLTVSGTNGPQLISA